MSLQMRARARKEHFIVRNQKMLSSKITVVTAGHRQRATDGDLEGQRSCCEALLTLRLGEREIQRSLIWVEMYGAMGMRETQRETERI